MHYSIQVQGGQLQVKGHHYKCAMRNKSETTVTNDGFVLDTGNAKGVKFAVAKVNKPQQKGLCLQSIVHTGCEPTHCTMTQIGHVLGHIEASSVYLTGYSI